ncbi:hypothetical protein FHS19_003098 [Paenibacillus rhizosphaerae]|uniref:Apiosidase-like catalytic domain-containing protein n=1 Tax=Paenibacillus rhizosphaerae TaxID=297318 RepID=A0A839TNG5_9BACL|nr:DUF4038 domain-containing protein [Paenibacillus rhizosphaerae]MBB3128444.1 hypothetical protein [Paenibacillus rhizosphaerae]
MITIDMERHLLLKDRQPFFYLADTVWNAFVRATPKEWETYLTYRRSQGYNVVRISAFGIYNDRSIGEDDLHPFEFTTKGKYDFAKVNEAYFDRAAEMAEAAVHHGFILDLTLFWLCYVKDTQSWPPDPDWVIPFERIEPLTHLLIDRFGRFDPIYCISGDTNFGSEDTIRYYMKAFKTVKGRVTNAVTTMHIAGNVPMLPEVFMKSELLDFVLYQSGHDRDNQQHAYTYALGFLGERPIINGEPCYEGMHFDDERGGHYAAPHVRRAMWSSLLAGAKAGFTYGAHGMWSWHREDERFLNGESLPGWETAMRFEGAWEAVSPNGCSSVITFTILNRHYHSFKMRHPTFVRQLQRMPVSS